MVGGPAAALERARPVLAAMGGRIVHIGDHGAGMVAKACNQLVVGSNIEAVAEALALARAAGVDPAKVREAMLGGFAASRILEVHGQRMLDRNFTPGARVAIHAKDARIVLETARRAGVDLPGFRPVAEGFQKLIERGDAGLDHSALITLLEEA
jgi:2-hydroxy-3-oxopropionate reductase